MIWLDESYCVRRFSRPITGSVVFQSDALLRIFFEVYYLVWNFLILFRTIPTIRNNLLETLIQFVLQAGALLNDANALPGCAAIEEM